MNAVAITLKRKPPSDIEVTPEAVRDAKQIQLGGDAVARLKRMAEKSAPVTHEFGNRRFDQFVLLVKDGKVLGVDRL